MRFTTIETLHQLNIKEQANKMWLKSARGLALKRVAIAVDFMLRERKKIL